MGAPLHLAFIHTVRRLI